MNMRKLGENIVGIILIFFLSYLAPMFAGISHKAGIWPSKFWLIFGILFISAAFWGGLGLAYAKQNVRNFLTVSLTLVCFMGSLFLGTIALSDVIVDGYGSWMPAPYPLWARWVAGLGVILIVVFLYPVMANKILRHVPSQRDGASSEGGRVQRDTEPPGQESDAP